MFAYIMITIGFIFCVAAGVIYPYEMSWRRVLDVTLISAGAAFLNAGFTLLHNL